MNPIKLYRRRYIPNEIIHLKNDEILFVDNERIVTKWDTISPRKDFSRGYSCYYINEGIKASKMIKASGELLYYYCDVIETIHKPDEQTYIFNDLLIDVIIRGENNVQVVDIVEVPEALEESLITAEQANYALRCLGLFLDKVYDNNFFTYAAFLEQFEENS